MHHISFQQGSLDRIRETYRIELLNSEANERFIVTGRIREVPGFRYYDPAIPVEVEQVGEAVAEMHRGMGLAGADA